MAVLAHADLHVKKMLVQTALSVFWKKWAAKHENEELKEGAWLEPGLVLLRKKVKENWTETHRNVPGRSCWKVDGCNRDCSKLIGRTPVNVKPARKRKEKRSRGFTIAQDGTRSDGRSQKLSGSWSRKQEPQRRSGSGKEVLSRTLSVKANGTGVISACKSGSGTDGLR